MYAGLLFIPLRNALVLRIAVKPKEWRFQPRHIHGHLESNRACNTTSWSSHETIMCLCETRVIRYPGSNAVLKDFYCWILDNKRAGQPKHPSLLDQRWSRKRRTMLLCGVIDDLKRSFGKSANISFFLCQGTDVRLNNAAAVLRGAIYSLVKEQPSLSPTCRASTHKRKKYPSRK